MKSTLFRKVRNVLYSGINMLFIPNFSKTVREFQYIHQSTGKRAQKIRERIQSIGKRNQSADTLAVFEK